MKSNGTARRSTEAQDASRLAEPVGAGTFIDTRRDTGFSLFDHVDDQYAGTRSVHRLCTLAEHRGLSTIATEPLAVAGAVAAENIELALLRPGYRMGALRRVTFWRAPVGSADEFKDACAAGHLIGYAILKNDVVPGETPGAGRWHVFESVLSRQEDGHRYIFLPRTRRFELTAGGSTARLEVEGVLYCEQNQLNKACAQTAIRSLAALHLDEELSYAHLNALAAEIEDEEEDEGGFKPAAGLSIRRVQHVVTRLGLRWTAFRYDFPPKTRQGGRPASDQPPPYQKYLYAGVESGAGALLGFRFRGRSKRRHMVPVFGHTFNRNTWVPHSSRNYFGAGENIRYLPSESWLSSFIMHDDTFGSYFHVPRFHLKPRQVVYAMAWQEQPVRYNGIDAEVLVAGYLDELRPLIHVTDRWSERLAAGFDDRQLILRAVSMSAESYVEHLRSLQDRHGRREDEVFCDELRRSYFLKKEHVWMVEISLPELFPRGERKLGEVVLDARRRLTPGVRSLPVTGKSFIPLMFARLPGRYIFRASPDDAHRPDFRFRDGPLISHTPVYSHARTTA